MYNTGDLGRIRADGRIEHLGRIDDQVKVKVAHSLTTSSYPLFQLTMHDARASASNWMVLVKQCAPTPVSRRLARFSSTKNYGVSMRRLLYHRPRLRGQLGGPCPTMRSPRDSLLWSRSR